MSYRCHSGFPRVLPFLCVAGHPAGGLCQLPQVQITHIFCQFPIRQMPPARGHAAQPEHGKYARTVCRWCVADKHRLVAPTPYRKPVLILFISMIRTEQMHSASRGQLWVMNALTKHSWISKGPVGKMPVCISCPCMLLQRDIGTCGLGEHRS